MNKLGPYELNQIIIGDTRDLIKAIPNESIDLIVTSPPYNLGSRYANVSDKAIQGKWSRVIQYDDYQDNMPEDDYKAWQHQTIRDLWRVIKPTGAIFYNHKPRIQNGELWHRLDLIPDDVTLRQVIIWKRPMGHNFNKGYFVPSFEWVFLLAKPDFILSNSGYGDVWEMSPDKNDHPAPFPLQLPFRAISSSRNVDLVFDPFTGSGTTLKAARMLGKRYLGFELVERFAERARLELSTIQPLNFARRGPQLMMDLAA